MTAAAERLGLQQPAVSKALMRIEADLGNPLFTRTRLGLLPTSFAERLAKEVWESKDDWHQRFERLIEGEKRVAGSFKIGSHPVLASVYLIKRFTKLLLEHDQLHLDLLLKRSIDVTKDVAEGNCHFGIVAGPSPHPELVVRTIGKEFAALWGKTVIKKNALVFYNPEMIQVQNYTRALKDYRLIPVSDYELIYSAVVNGDADGAILPSQIAGRSSRLKTLSKPFYSTEIKFIYRYDLPKTVATRAIIDSFVPVD